MLSIKTPARFLDFSFSVGPTQASSDPTRTEPDSPVGFFCFSRAAQARVIQTVVLKTQDFMGQTEIKTSSSSTLTQPNITP